MNLNTSQLLKTPYGQVRLRRVYRSRASRFHED